MLKITSALQGAAFAAAVALAVARLSAQPGPGADLRWQRDPSVTCSTSSTPVTLSSAEAARVAGFEYADVAMTPLTREIERNAELVYNANRYARLSSRASGVVLDVKKDLGEPVKQGEVLVIVDSSDFGSAKSNLLQGVETLKLWDAVAARERELVEKGVGVERDALEAETRAAESRIAANRARQHLRSFGLSKEQVDAVERDGDTSPLLEITAPFSGTLVERTVVMGEVAEPGKPVVALADTGLMWAMVDLAESDLASVRTGMQAEVTLDGLAGRAFAGRITWISTQVDPRTRTIKARVELDNGDGLLRAHMYGRVRIDASGERQAVTVPKSAVQWEGCCNVAFVRTDAEGVTFRPARLVLGYDAGDRYEVITGLRVGETIVTRGSFILKNEVLKDAVGAGCCEIDHLAK